MTSFALPRGAMQGTAWNEHSLEASLSLVLAPEQFLGASPSPDQPVTV